MKPWLARSLYWSPRIFGLLFTAFITLFALDAFQSGRPPGENLRALAMHLLPTAGLSGLLALAWRWPWVGAAGFPALAAGYLLAFQGRFPWFTYAVIAGPLLLLGALFLMDGCGRCPLWRGRFRTG